MSAPPVSSYGISDLYREHSRVIGVILVCLSLFLILALKSVSLTEWVVHAVMMAGLILLFAGGTSAESGTSSKELCDSLERSASSNNRLSNELKAAIVQASNNQVILDRLREDMKVERRDMQEMKAKADLLRSELRQCRDREAVLKQSLEKAIDDAVRMQMEAKSLTEEIRAFRSDQEQRLARMLPEGILSSQVRLDVLQCYHSASEGSDPGSALILASLQALAAIKRGNLPTDKVSSYLKAIGEALYLLCAAKQDGPEEVSKVFNDWAKVLNDCATNDYTVFVPIIGAPADLDKMAGIDRGNVRSVLCWGVRSNNRGVEYPAQVN